jgi:peptide deformylase
MAIRPVVLYPDSVLLEPTRPVERVDEEIRDLVRDMVDTMYNAPGVGLAANQIGVPLRLFIVDLSVGEEPGALRVFINPVVLETSGSQTGEEGCLSFPDVSLEVERPAVATVEALDLEGERFTLTAEGLLARAVLHEHEHLQGETFLQNVSALRRELVKKRIRKRIKTGDWVEAAAK